MNGYENPVRVQDKRGASPQRTLGTLGGERGGQGCAWGVGLGGDFEE